MSRTQRLVVVLVLNLGLVAALVTVGITAHSLAVLAEGSDYLLDAAGIAVALLAIRLSARPAGRARPAPTDVAALVNCGWLLVLEVLVVGVDILFFRHQFWARLIVNVGIVLVFGAFYLRFLKRP